MLSSIRRKTLRNIASPIGLASAAYAVFLLSWTFPPSLYTYYLHEPDLMFLDPLLFVYFTACVLAFIFGVKSAAFFGLARRTVTLRSFATNNPISYLGIPLSIASGLSLVFIAMLGGRINFLALLASNQGTAIKLAGASGLTNVGGQWGASVPALMVVLWWAYLRKDQLQVEDASSKAIIWIFFAGALLTGLLACIATVDRTQLMPLVIGLFLIYLYKRTHSHEIRLSRILLSVAGGFASIIVLFVFFQYLRGALLVNLLIQSVLGYSIVSYNRLAALLHGQMSYTYGGRGAYLFPVLVKGNTLNAIFGFRETFNWPDWLTIYYSETASVALSGLRPMYIWSGVFGYLYSDLGWGALGYVFGVGILAGWTWTRFRLGEAWAISLYLWIAWWVVFWVGSNMLFDIRIVTMLETGLILTIYDRMRLRPVLASTADREVLTANIE